MALVIDMFMAVYRPFVIFFEEYVVARLLLSNLTFYLVPVLFSLAGAIIRFIQFWVAITIC
jgi:hypothetical protein